MDKRNANIIKTNTAKENIAQLPNFCYSADLVYRTIIRIHAGESGYYPCYGPSYPTYEAAQRRADQMNRDELGITNPAIRQAMEMGSMFGWELPGANIANYDANGKGYCLAHPRPADADEFARAAGMTDGQMMQAERADREAREMRDGITPIPPHTMTNDICDMIQRQVAYAEQAEAAAERAIPNRRAFDHHMADADASIFEAERLARRNGPEGYDWVRRGPVEVNDLTWSKTAQDFAPAITVTNAQAENQRLVYRKR